MFPSAGGTYLRRTPLPQARTRDRTRVGLRLLPPLRHAGMMGVFALQAGGWVVSLRLAPVRSAREDRLDVGELALE